MSEVMYVCTNCETLLCTPVTVRESYGELSEVCSQCGGVPVETYKCDICDEYITGDYILTSEGSRICHECYHLYNIIETRELDLN